MPLLMPIYVQTAYRYSVFLSVSEELLALERGFLVSPSDLSSDLDSFYSHLEDEAINRINVEASKMEEIINGDRELL